MVVILGEHARRDWPGTCKSLLALLPGEWVILGGVKRATVGRLVLGPMAGHQPVALLKHEAGHSALLAKRAEGMDSPASIRRIGICWEATRAPRGTRIPQAWAAWVAQAGLLRVRRECEKSQEALGGQRPPVKAPVGHRASAGRQQAGEDLQTQVFLGAQPLGPPRDDPNLVVEPLDESQGRFVLRLAEGRTAIPVRCEHADKLLAGLEPLPFPGGFPVLEEAPRPARALAAPEPPEGFLEPGTAGGCHAAVT